jgi:hypothetical protein
MTDANRSPSKQKHGESIEVPNLHWTSSTLNMGVITKLYFGSFQNIMSDLDVKVVIHLELGT